MTYAGHVHQIYSYKMMWIFTGLNKQDYIFTCHGQQPSTTPEMVRQVEAGE